jgi:PDZ domain-containing secreted protein
VLALTPKEFDREFREWVRALPEVPEEIKPGMASLGLEIDAGEGEGVIVTRLMKPQFIEGSLKVGDVVTAIDDKPVRDQAELVRVLAGFAPGDEVSISYRRAKKLGECRLKLVAKPRSR